MRWLRTNDAKRDTRCRLDDDALYITWLVLATIEVAAILIFGVLGNFSYLG